MGLMINKILSSLYSWILMVVLVITVITANSFYVVDTLDELSALEAKLFSTKRIKRFGVLHQIGFITGE